MHHVRNWWVSVISWCNEDSWTSWDLCTLDWRQIKAWQGEVQGVFSPGQHFHLFSSYLITADRYGSMLLIMLIDKFWIHFVQMNHTTSYQWHILYLWERNRRQILGWLNLHITQCTFLDWDTNQWYSKTFKISPNGQKETFVCTWGKCNHMSTFHFDRGFIL